MDWIFEKFKTWHRDNGENSLYSRDFNFHNETSDFDEDNCYALAQLCGQSYNLDPEKIRQWGLDSAQIEIESSRCTIFWNEEYTILAFAGTDSISDLIRDISIEGVHWSDISYVHKGFLESTMKIYEPILFFLEENFLLAKPLWITGHSLGAAQCIITALNLFKESPDFFKKYIKGIYTFAQPKVGGPFFCKEAHDTLSSIFFRIVNEGDIIPFLPDKGFLPDKTFNYEHLKTRYFKYGKKGEGSWIESEKNFQDLPKLVEIMKKYQSNLLKLRKSMEAMDIPDIIDYNSRYFFQTAAFFLDHAIEIYIKKAKKNAEKNSDEKKRLT